MIRPVTRLLRVRQTAQGDQRSSGLVLLVSIKPPHPAALEHCHNLFPFQRQRQIPPEPLQNRRMIFHHHLLLFRVPLESMPVRLRTPTPPAASTADAHTSTPPPSRPPPLPPSRTAAASPAAAGHSSAPAHS